MGKAILFILALAVLGILYAIPLWATVNLCMFAFHLPYHLTLLQAITICALLNIIRTLLFHNDKEEK